MKLPKKNLIGDYSLLCGFWPETILLDLQRQPYHRPSTEIWSRPLSLQDMRLSIEDALTNIPNVMIKVLSWIRAALWGVHPRRHIILNAKLNTRIHMFVVQCLSKQIDFSSHTAQKLDFHLINTRFFWPDIYADIDTWCEGCMPCQQNKIGRHTKRHNCSSRHCGTTQLTWRRLIFKPRYLLTIIGAYTRWMEAVPSLTSDISAAQTFLSAKESKFGPPLTVSFVSPYRYICHFKQWKFCFQ